MAADMQSVWKKKLTAMDPLFQDGLGSGRV